MSCNHYNNLKQTFIKGTATTSLLGQQPPEYLHKGTILSILGIHPRDFAFVTIPKGFIPMEIALTYISKIILLSNRCVTLVRITILSSNKFHINYNPPPLEQITMILPSNSHPIRQALSNLTPLLGAHCLSNRV